MINFFVKAGRPSAKEKELAEKIRNALLQAEKDGNKELISTIESRGAVYNFDGLKEIMGIIENKNTNNNSSNNSTTMGKKNEEEDDNSFSSRNNSAEEEVGFEPTIDMQTESPLQQPVVEREDELEKFKQERGMGGESPGNDSGERDDVDDAFEEPRSSGDNDSAGEDFTARGAGGGLKDVPDDTKRKAIKKTADIVAKIYAGVLPLPVKMISKISEAKLERMSWNDEVDLSMGLELPDGTRTNVGDYIRGYNATLDAELVVTPEMQDDLKDCLKDVLEEKQVAMTPIQRLTATVCAHAFTLFSVGIQNTVMMKKNLEYWKEVHEENKRRSNPTQRQSHSTERKDATPPPQAEAPAPKPKEEEASAHKNPPLEFDGNNDAQEESDEMSINPKDAEVK